MIHHFKIPSLFVLTLWAWCFGINNSLQAQNTAFVVIVNNGNPIGEMNAGQVKLYYLRKVKKRWPGIEKNIRPVDRSGNPPVRAAFLSKVLGMTGESVNQYFVQKQYASAETPPTKLANDTEVINYVADNIGAIGYVSYATFQAAQGKVKAVLVIQ